tara:strand:+ start:1514 stop:2467 length:954 start_codon:yes stop_codon:yes gene_type:complete
MTFRVPSSGKLVFGSYGKTVIRPSASVITAIGGSIFDYNVGDVTYRTHTFTSSGILTVTSATNNIASVEYIVVAGGGGGGSGATQNIPGPSIYITGGSGGGAGGLRTGPVSLTIGSYSITVGGGGAASVSGAPSKIVTDQLLITLFESIGGGAGANAVTNNFGLPGSLGGSGGGGATGGGLGGSASPPGQGFPGGDASSAYPSFSQSGGGGGAGSAGVPGSVMVVANGGSGYRVPFFPSLLPNVFYAGGGGAGISAPVGINTSLGGSGVGGNGGVISSNPGKDAVVSTGSGGGGGRGPGIPGGQGSGGIVIIRYIIS